jgi:hypothetical protein
MLKEEGLKKTTTNKQETTTTKNPKESKDLNPSPSFTNNEVCDSGKINEAL